MLLEHQTWLHLPGIPHYIPKAMKFEALFPENLH